MSFRFALLLFLTAFSAGAAEFTTLAEFSHPIGDFHEILLRKQLNAQNCAATLGNANDDLFSEKVANGLNRKAPEEVTRDLIQTLFRIRVELRHSLGDMIKGNVSEACVDEIRHTLRNVRVLEEYLIEWNGNFAPQLEAFQGDFPSVLRNTSARGITLEDGDLILSRGNAMASSMISRFGHVDGLFSHLSIVHVDPQTKEPFVIQGEAEGTLITPWKEYASDGKLRAVIFRQNDRALAKRAADYIYKRAKAAIDAGEPIPYDFTMRLDDDSQLFCAEVTYVAYKNASQGNFLIAPFLSKFTKQSDHFLEQLGVLTRNTLLPMDIELDPRFELIAEWRNVGATSDARMKDAIFSRFFLWMSRDGFEFEPGFEEKLLENLGWLIRRWPVLELSLVHRFPLHMKTSIIGLYFVMSNVGEPLADILNEMNTRNVATTGYPMTYSETLKALDNLLERDKVLWKEWKDWFDRSGPFPRRPEEPEPPIILEKFHPPGYSTLINSTSK